MGKTKLKTSWNLDHIVSLKNWPKLYGEIEADLVTMAEWWQKLSPDMSAKNFIEFMAFDETFTVKVTRLAGRPGLWKEADQNAAEAKRLASKADDLMLKISAVTTKIGLWFKGKEIKNKKPLDDKNAKRLFAAVPDLAYVLTYSRQTAKYVLSEPEETLEDIKNTTGLGPLVEVRDMLETDFRFSLKLPGKKQPLAIDTLEELKRYIYSDQANHRQAAYQTMLGKYHEQRDKFFLVYQAVVKDWGLMGQRRGFTSAIARRNFGNHVPDKAIEVLLEVVTKNRDLFQEFFRWKAKQLKQKTLRRFDLYAPLGKVKQSFTYDQALGLVRQTFAQFSPAFSKHAEQIITDRHIDVYPDKAKRSGAFCVTLAPKITPYVLLNFTNTWRDVTTLAHELGHGVHSLYASGHSISSQHANLPLAETASTLAEMMLFEKMLTATKTIKDRQAMLADKIGDSFASILRQAYFTKFELAAHEAIGKGATPDDLGRLWLATLKEQFGNAVAVDPIFKNEWLYVTHFVHSPFYCYAYPFGELLSLALYACYKKDGKSFVPQIEKILAAGGSVNPDQILKEVGIDMTDPNFWQGSFDIIKGWVKELKSLT